LSDRLDLSREATLCRHIEFAETPVAAFYTHRYRVRTAERSDAVPWILRDKNVRLPDLTQVWRAINNGGP
jgi:hypothetical protein